MLSRLIGFSLRQSSLVVVLAGLLVVIAGLKLRGMPVDVFPELNAPTVVIMSEAGGLAADEVETNVTFPIETAVNGLAGARRVRSSSATSLSIVWVEFDWGTDIYRARQLVSERLSAVRESLPDAVHAEITPVTSITGEVMLLALSSPDGTATPLAVREYAEFTLRNRLLAVPGVAQVVAIGGELQQYQVEVRQERLARLGISIDEVVEAAAGAHSTATAGYLSNVENQELPIRQNARVRGVDDIARTLVRMDGATPVTVGDVAADERDLGREFAGHRRAAEHAYLVAAGEAATDHGLAEEAGAAGDKDDGRSVHRARRAVHSLASRRRCILALCRTSTGRARWKTMCFTRAAPGLTLASSRSSATKRSRAASVSGKEPARGSTTRAGVCCGAVPRPMSAQRKTFGCWRNAGSRDSVGRSPSGVRTFSTRRP